MTSDQRNRIDMGTLLNTVFLKIFAIVLLVCANSCSAANCIEQSDLRGFLSNKLGVEISVARVVSFEQAEQKSLARLATAEDFPKIPFGRLSKQWMNLKSKANAGDRLIYFDSSDESWTALHGREGYILIRCSEIIDMLIIRMS